MAKRVTILFWLLFVLLVVFDAGQQKYYIDTFDLAVEPVPLISLLKNHLIRWSFWMVSAIPFGIYLWHTFNQSHGRIKQNQLLKFVGTSMLAVCFALLLVTLQVLWSQSISLTWQSFNEAYLFFIFQKGLTFFLAYGMVILVMLDQVRGKRLRDQRVEILFLKRDKEQRNAVERMEPYLQIKIGHQLKTLPVEDIIWIQADDYCVKVHTVDEKSYTIRRSMKYLEEQLAGYRFVRVHRGALLNLNFLDQVNTSKSTVKLSNQAEIVASKSGIRSLKKEIEASTL